MKYLPRPSLLTHLELVPNFVINMSSWVYWHKPGGYLRKISRVTWWIRQRWQLPWDSRDHLTTASLRHMQGFVNSLHMFDFLHGVRQGSHPVESWVGRCRALWQDIGIDSGIHPEAWINFIPHYLIWNLHNDLLDNLCNISNFITKKWGARSESS